MITGNKEIIIVIVVIIVGITLVTFIVNTIIKVINLSKEEILIKQRKIEEKNIEKIIFNGKELPETENEELKEILINFVLEGEYGLIDFKYSGINNVLQVLTTDHEKIEFKFYFNKKCRHSRVLVKNGMISADLQDLCEFLGDNKN